MKNLHRIRVERPSTFNLDAFQSNLYGNFLYKPTYPFHVEFDLRGAKVYFGHDDKLIGVITDWRFNSNGQWEIGGMLEKST